ncbi:MAG: hypothetical protein RBS55_10700 [Bacteroidales bacterium]|jgi:hypothetical protein|nr:hypothetical protein [Bacteroidales bacterium]
MIDLSIEDKRYFLPDNWQEITRKDLLIIADLYTRYLGSTDFLKYALIRMLGIRRYLVRYHDQIAFAKGLYRVLPIPAIIQLGINRGRVKVFPQDDLLVLSQMLSWITADISAAKSMLTRNLLPGITVRRSIFSRLHLYGPADQLRDVIAIEFAHADKAFLDYCTTGDPDKLEDLVGVLYRPQKWYWRIERLFTDKNNSLRMRYTGLRYGRSSCSSLSVSLPVKYAVLLYFQGCRNELLSNYPYVYTSDGGSDGHSTGWAGVFRALTNEKITDLDKVLELPIHTVLFDLNEKIRINKQNEKLKTNA